MWEDAFGKGTISLAVEIQPNGTRIVKRKELNDEFNGKTSITDKLKFVSFKLSNKNCSIAEKIGRHITVFSNENGTCHLQAGD
jgi:hypothetical protein